MKKYQTCAACRHKRSKSVGECPLAPYFPSHMHQQYNNAHKVFGESHLMKLLQSLPPHKRSTAMKHIILEARIRVTDPVGGSYGLIRNLQLQIAEKEEELRRLRDVPVCFVVLWHRLWFRNRGTLFLVGFFMHSYFKNRATTCLQGIKLCRNLMSNGRPIQGEKK